MTSPATPTVFDKIATEVSHLALLLQRPGLVLKLLPLLYLYAGGTVADWIVRNNVSAIVPAVAVAAVAVVHLVALVADAVARAHAAKHLGAAATVIAQAEPAAAVAAASALTATAAAAQAITHRTILGAHPQATP